MDFRISNQQIFATKFSPDQSMFAASTEDGLIKVICNTTGEPLYSIVADSEAAKKGDTIYPVTSLAWKPNFSENQYD
jgi:WD40 repeat protein